MSYYDQLRGKQQGLGTKLPHTKTCCLPGCNCAWLSAHAVGAEWLETDCVTINACEQTVVGGARHPCHQWLHANTSVLVTSASTHTTEMMMKGVYA